MQLPYRAGNEAASEPSTSADTKISALEGERIPRILTAAVSAFKKGKS